MENIEYRIVKWYHSFFCHWCYRLEKKHTWKFLWWSGSGWTEVAGNSLTKYAPAEWGDLNIVSEITEEIGSTNKL